jgi:hypothetical protein
MNTNWELKIIFAQTTTLLLQIVKCALTKFPYILDTITVQFHAAKYLQLVLHNSHYFTVQGKGKAIPLQAWTGPEGPRKLRFTDFKTIGV